MDRDPDEWPEPEGDFGARRRPAHDPLARALRNSPLFPCPDLDNNITPEDQERAGMGHVVPSDCACRGAWRGPDGRCIWPQCNPDVWGGAWRSTSP